MPVFLPKNGDAMGEEVSRFTKQARQEWARMKKNEEEARLAEDPELARQTARLMEKKRLEMRKAVGLE